MIYYLITHLVNIVLIAVVIIMALRGGDPKILAVLTVFATLGIIAMAPDIATWSVEGFGWLSRQIGKVAR